jgi:hypothetical protein
MKFTCHAINDGDVHNGSTIGWCIVGEGRFWKGGFLETLKGRVSLEFAGAEFEESFGINWGEEQHLRLGVEAYRRWWERTHK